jgi:hypothetical protein
MQHICLAPPQLLTPDDETRRKNMRFKGRTHLVALAAVAALAVAAPAMAQTGASVGTGVGGHTTAVDSSDDGLTTVRVGGNFTGVLAGQGLQIVFECDAQGVGAVAATALDECYVEVAGVKYHAATPNLPGAATVTTATVQTPIAEVKLCVTGRAVPVLGDDATATACADTPIGGSVTLPTIDDFIIAGT